MRVLTFEDLYNFFKSKNQSIHFSSAQPGDEIVISSIGHFDFVEDNISEGLLYCKIRAFHDLTNKNHSHIKSDVFEAKLATMKDRPIMADIVDSTDESGETVKDFSGHTMEYDEENEKTIYIEKPIGHFVNPENFHTEYDEEYDRTFAVADCVIYEEYSDACDILRRRKTVDCSVELCVKDMSYDAAAHVLILNDYYVQGCTLLGADVAPGMAGSMASIDGFDEQTAVSFNQNYTNELVEMREKIDQILSRFNNTGENSPMISTKGGNTEVNKFEELCQKYGKTADDITFDYSEMSDEELETAFAEAFEDDNSEPEPVADPETTPVVENLTRTYEISHEDIRYALYNLIAQYEELDNEWYWIDAVYDDSFVFSGNKIWGQKYTKDGNEVALSGERYELFAEYLTATEKATLESMRADYSEIKEQLQKYQDKEAHEYRVAAMSNEDYSVLFDTKEYADLQKEMDTYSVEELNEKLTSMVGRYSIAHKVFAKDPDSQKANKVSLFNRDESVQDNPFKTLFTKDELKK